jgi:hypothetical protein
MCANVRKATQKSWSCQSQRSAFDLFANVADNSADRQLPNGSAFHDCFIQDAAINLFFPGFLCRRQYSLSSSRSKEARFLVEKEAFGLGVGNYRKVRICCWILLDPPKAIKEIARVDPDKPINAYVSDVGLMPGHCIANVAVFLDILAAWARINSSLTSTDSRTHSVRAALKVLD